MTTAQICIAVAIILYLCFIICVGIFINRRGTNTNSDEFFLAGRKLGPLVTAMSAEASDMSSWLLMGLPGLAYLTGLAEPVWTAVGLAVGTYLNWLIVARRLRRYSANLGAITIPDFFSKRYRDERNVLSCIAGIMIIVFFVPYVASGFKAVGTLFSSLFGVDYHTAMIVGAIIIIIYTVLGGLTAVATIDLIQSIVMTAALIIIVCFGIYQAGGWSQVVANAQAMTGYLNVTQGYNTATSVVGSYGALPIASTLAWGLGYFGMPHILVRFMAIRDERELKLSRRIGSVWVVISMGVAILIGVIGYSVSKAGKIITLTTSADSETIVVQLSNLLSQYGVILALVAGVVLAGIMACTMSTADSQLLSAASAVSNDLMDRFLGIKMSVKRSMLVARCTVIVIAIVGVALAWNPNSSVFRIVSFAWAGFGGAFGALMLFSLFWKRTTKAGALAGMVVGGVMVFVWKFGIARLGGAFAIYELLPAFIASAVVIVVVSLLTAKPSQEICDEFDAVNSARS